MKNKWFLAVLVVVLGLVFSTVFPAGIAFAVNCEKNPDHWKCDGDNNDDPGHGHNGTTPGWYHHYTGNGTCKEKYFEMGQKPNAEWEEGKCPKEEPSPTPEPTDEPKPSPTPTEEPPSPTPKPTDEPTPEPTKPSPVPTKPKVETTTPEVVVEPAVCKDCVTVPFVIDEPEDMEWAVEALQAFENEGYYCPGCVEVIVVFDEQSDLDWVFEALTELENAGYHCEVTDN